MPIRLLPFILGIISIRWFSFLPPTFICFSLLIIGILLTLSRAHRIGLFCLGVAWSALFSLFSLHDRLDPLLDGETIWIEATIAGLPEKTERATRFQVSDPSHQRIILPSNIRLSWYGAQQVIPGERWLFKVRLRYPRGTVNPYSFDYEAWLTSKKIGAIGTVKQGKKLTSASSLATWRYELRRQLVLNTPINQGAGLSALILGDGSGITQAQWKVLQNTGTTHLMVISGQHISLLAAAMYFIIASLFRLGYWPSKVPWLYVACTLSLLVAVTYSLLVGFEVSVYLLLFCIIIKWLYFIYAEIAPLIAPKH